jgi:hypothetical protein
VLTPPAQGYRGKPQRNYFEKGLLRKYALQDVTYEFFVAEDRLPRSYKDTCRQALEKHGEGTKYDLALIQIEESFHQLPRQVHRRTEACLSSRGTNVPRPHEVARRAEGVPCFSKAPVP